MMNPDQYEKDLMACVHCGLCLHACPTYLETGSEADSPRGRIVLMRGLHEGRFSPADADVTAHIDACLGCRACETACPSDVPYGSLIEVARARINDAGIRPAAKSAARRALLETMAHPDAMTLAMQGARAAARLAAPDRRGTAPDNAGALPARVGRLLSNHAADAKAGAQRINLPHVISPALPPAFTPAAGTKRFRVAVLTGCAMRVLYGDVNRDTVRVLAANGCEVLVNRRQGCCGALHAHNGFTRESLAYARQLIDAFTPFDGLDAIIVNSAGCGSTMKEYGAALADDPKYAERAARFASLVRDVCEFLDSFPEGVCAPSPSQLDGDAHSAREGHVTVAYHDACHLAHGQQIREAPRRLLARIPDIRLVPLPESEICCGSAGIYNLTEPEMAQRLQQRKINNILNTGATIVATGNPGCLAWIETGLRAAGQPAIRVAHPVTLLAEALDGPIYQ